MVTVRFYDEPDFDKKEIMRYAGCGETDAATDKLIDSCIAEVRPLLTYKVCCCEFAVAVSGDVCSMGELTVASRNLAKNLDGCRSVIIFAGTVGVEIDRLILKYGSISPSRAVIIQAIGAERIEALCDIFCKEMAAEHDTALRPRFSPGFGDLSLSVQKDIFNVLNCSRHIGIFLRDSLIMSPSKSVTAFVGVE